MLGFTLPLAIILGLESFFALLLLGPRATAGPALVLCRGTKTAVGRTVLHTVAGFLLVSLASPAYDLARLQRGPGGDAASPSAGMQWASRSEAEANAYLAMVMILAALLLMVLVRRFGLVLLELESGKVSQGAMLKQVKGLQTEYQRLLDSGGGYDGAARGGEAGKLREQLDEARALEPQLKEAQAAQAAAERNLQVVRSQAKGLETEYDRLLAELDEAHRKLKRAQEAPAHAEPAPQPQPAPPPGMRQRAR